MPIKPPACGNCALWNGPRGKHGHPLDRSGRCGAPIPERPLVSAGFDLEWPPRARTVWPDDGAADCPTYEANK